MSAKGRGPSTGGKHNRNFTPAWAVDRLLEKWTPARPDGTWLEAGAGDGAIIRAVSRHQAQHWHAIEVGAKYRLKLYDAGASIVTIGDFLSATAMPPKLSGVTVALGNPPFTWAMEFLMQIWTLCPGAEVVQLLPLNFEASAKRHPILQPHPPDRFVLPDRPSFTMNGQTDAQDYAWFRWAPGNRQRGVTKILDTTPVSERRGRR